MFLYFAIRPQSNFHSLQSTPIVAGLQDCQILQDCRMLLENWKSSVLDCYEILQNSYVIAMGFWVVVTCRVARFWNRMLTRNPHIDFTLSYENY